MAKNNTYQIVSVILLLGVIAFAGLYFTKTVECPECEICTECEICETCEICPEIPEEKAEMDAMIYDWGISAEASNKLLFQYWVYNYGPVEARNIKVRCKLEAEAGKVEITELDTFGNLASHSAEFGEFTPLIDYSRGYSSSTAYSAYCYVESCDNCEILYERIPLLAETLTK